MRITVRGGIGLLIGFGLLVAAAFLYQDSLRVRNKYTGMPVKIALSLTSGEMDPPEFTAEKGNYWIEIAPGSAVIDGRTIDISWTVSDQGRAIAQGHSTQNQGSDGADQLIGSFHLERGGRYHLHLTVRRLAGTPVSSPRELLVVPDPGGRDDIAMGAGFAELEALICGVVGLLVLSLAIVNTRRIHRVVRSD
jgi:hypothetical protein